MKVLIFDTDETATEFDKLSEQLMREKILVQKYRLDTKDGTPVAETYDVTRSPATLVVDGVGTIINQWYDKVPAAGDVKYFVRGMM